MADCDWVTDAELIRRIGVPEKKARVQLRELDRKASGFPRKQKSWGDRRTVDAQMKKTQAISSGYRNGAIVS